MTKCFYCREEAVGFKCTKRTGNIEGSGSIGVAFRYLCKKHWDGVDWHTEDIEYVRYEDGEEEEND